MQVTEKWLGEIGGWQAMKAAREFVRVGAVSEAACEGGNFRGLVGAGQRKYRAVLVTGDGKRVEAKCGCPDAQRGLICAHALAVALAVISPAPGAAKDAGPPSKSSVAGQGSPVQPQPKQKAERTLRDEDIPSGEFTVFIATDQLEKVISGLGDTGKSATSRPSAPRTSVGHGGSATVPVFLQFQPGGTVKERGIANWLARRDLPVRSLPLRLPVQELGDLLTAIEGHPRVQSGASGGQIKDAINSEKHTNILITSTFKILARCSYNISMQLFNFEAVKSDSHLLFGKWFWSEHARMFARLTTDLSQEVSKLVLELTHPKSTSRPAQWVASHLDELCQVFEPSADDDALQQLRVIPVQPRFRLHLDGNLRRLSARIDTLFPGGTEEIPEAAYPVRDPENPWLYWTRNRPAEQGAVRRLEGAGFVTAGRSELELKGEREIVRFLSSDLPRLKRHFEVLEGDGWRQATRGISIIRPKVRPPARTEPAGVGMDWLSLEVTYESTDGFSISRNEVLRLIRSGQRSVQGQGGRRYLLDAEGCEELEATVQDMESHFEAGNRLAVRSRQAEVLEDFVDRPEVLALHQCPPLDVLTLRLKLGSLGNMLRPYQLEGVQWMERHHRTRGGGVLADEMGLGKTVQTLAMLRAILAGRDATDLKRGPALVICPTSLLGNWADEAQRFTPELRTHISHDSDRHANLRRLSDFDVIFTSYTLIVRDLKHYITLKFSCIILDEASYIRNPDTETAKSVRRLRADSRFALTGTPVENSVRDLWSIFEFLLPRCLPVREDFHERFVKPLSQPDNTKARPVMERLRRLIRPNLLRRTKREVAKDLPEKIEKTLWCQLSGAQREVYQRLLDEGREEIRQARRRSGQGGARMTMFTVLLRLRQVCNDLRLVGIDQARQSGSEPVEHDSGKWPVFEELLQESMDGGHKVLIFSQFVGMLRLVRAKAEALKIPYSYLDGSSQDRADQVASFQADPSKRLFLISLKAGGYGLNLTAADEVVLMDPWWNPAVEAQAIDRAHRIGQGKPVTAYRLITRGTVEEKILKLQAQKRAVMDMAMEDDATILSGLTDADLDALLE